MWSWGPWGSWWSLGKNNRGEQVTCCFLINACRRLVTLCLKHKYTFSRECIPQHPTGHCILAVFINCILAVFTVLKNTFRSHIVIFLSRLAVTQPRANKTQFFQVARTCAFGSWLSNILSSYLKLSTSLSASLGCSFGTVLVCKGMNYCRHLRLPIWDCTEWNQRKVMENETKT